MEIIKGFENEINTRDEIITQLKKENNQLKIDLTTEKGGRKQMIEGIMKSINQAEDIKSPVIFLF